MAARVNPLFDIAMPTQPLVDEPASEPRSAFARLAMLHAEAKETARLANLLGRSLYAAFALPAASTLTIILTWGASAASAVAWTIFIIVASLAIARTYAVAIGRPFESAALRTFARDLRAVLLYAGFAWGAGAFLILSAAAPIGSVLAFATAPALGLGLLLRERSAALLFLAPVAALTSFACVLRPLTAGAVNAALVLIVCAFVAGALALAERRAVQTGARATPAGVAGV